MSKIDETTGTESRRTPDKLLLRHLAGRSMRPRRRLRPVSILSNFRGLT
jgi:hypothetical protein